MPRGDPGTPPGRIARPGAGPQARAGRGPASSPIQGGGSIRVRPHTERIHSSRAVLSERSTRLTDQAWEARETGVRRRRKLA